MDVDELEWVLRGMAWVSLRHWQCGRIEGDRARAWLWDELDRRLRPGRPLLTADLERLEAQLWRSIHTGPGGGAGFSDSLPARTDAARTPEFGSVA